MVLVLSILVTAPLGSILIMALGPKLLKEYTHLVISHLITTYMAEKSCPIFMVHSLYKMVHDFLDPQY